MPLWSYIPPLQEEGGLKLKVAVKVSFKKWRRLAFSGVIIGLTLLLQGMNQFILSEFGFTDTQAGSSNCIYQATSAIIGIFVSTRITDFRGIKSTLRLMIGLGSIGYVLFASFAVYLNSKSDYEVAHSDFDFTVVNVLMAVLGSSLMGALPLLLLECIFEVNEEQVRTLRRSERDDAANTTI